MYKYLCMVYVLVSAPYSILDLKLYFKKTGKLERNQKFLQDFDQLNFNDLNQNLND